MAEARPHALVQHLRSRGFNVTRSPDLLDVSSNKYLLIRIPYPSTLLHLVRSSLVQTLIHINKSVWPATPATLATVILGVTWGTVQASPTSWLRSGWLAELLWNLDEALNPARHRLSVSVRVAYLAIIASFLGMLGIALTQRLLLRALLSWKGWAYTRLSIPLHVKFWGQAVRTLAGGPSWGTFAYEAALPYQPLPGLRATVARTIESLLPLASCDPAQLDQLADSFLRNEGPRLQRLLMLRHFTSSNYVTDYWERFVYLMGRGPLLIHSNYFVMDAVKSRPTADPVFRAANLIFRMLDFEDQIAAEVLPPSLLRETVPLDMSQYRRLFGTTRVPGADMDSLSLRKQSPWIVVTRRNRFFKLYTRHAQSHERLSHAELAHQLRVIAEEAVFDKSPVCVDVMALTTLPRAQWARIRRDELEGGPNLAFLHAVEGASFVVHLHDQPSDQSPAKNPRKKLLRQARALFHGDGASLWLDKSLQLVVFDDGRAGLNVEHSWGDAAMVSHLFEYALLSELHDVAAGVDASSLAGEALRGDPLPIPLKLEFDASDELRAEAARARRQARDLIADLDMDLLEFAAFGQAAIKARALSPDAFVQLALQLAYLRVFAQLDLVYESCTARLFRRGRTETIRSLTSESKAFCAAVVAGNRPKLELAGLLRAANDKHAALSRAALTGDGVDRHLFALYVAARGSGTPSPFLDYCHKLPWRLSTAQQPQKQTSLRDGLSPMTVRDFFSSGGGFAPADDEGLGVCYTFGGDATMFFYVTCKARSRVDSETFCGALQQALLDCMAVVT